jgi:endonuclease/exonuclease/phosphatase family metal-dependent hydrolase
MFTVVIPALSVIVASAALAPQTAQALPGARPLDVMTFNIHHAAGTDEVLSTERIAEVIRDNGAEVVGLQEVDRHFSERSEWADQPAELAELLGYHVVFGANIDNDPPEGSEDRIQYGTAILSKYPITDWENTYLYNTPGQEQRGLLRATIDVRGRDLQFYSTHLAASSQVDRLEQSRQIVELVGDEDPAIIVGDFNATPEAPEIQTLDAAFVDAWAEVGKGDGSTYPTEDPTKRIDNIYVTSSVKPVSAKVLHSRAEASDHLPVISRVVIEP